MIDPKGPLSDELRATMARVDAFDDQLVDLLAERFACSRRIGRIKAGLSMALTDPTRVGIQVCRFADACAARGIDRAWAEALIRAIIRQVVTERSDPRFR